MTKNTDILCIGNASWDIILHVSHHPAVDEKMFAENMTECGGGPAANAAVTAARFGCSVKLVCQLGLDHFGDKHLLELEREGIDTKNVYRSTNPTPLSVILVKPDGDRALVNYRKQVNPVSDTQFCEQIKQTFQPKVVLCDGHEPYISLELVQHYKAQHIPSVLDAGSVHEGTLLLYNHVDHLICSEKFARQFTGETQPVEMLNKLAEKHPQVIITLGAKGVIWCYHGEKGELPAFVVDAKDTTGAGDIFHGAFAVCLSKGMQLLPAIEFSSAAAALGCTQIGARPGIPELKDVIEFVQKTNKTGHFSPFF